MYNVFYMHPYLYDIITRNTDTRGNGCEYIERGSEEENPEDTP